MLRQTADSSRRCGVCPEEVVVEFRVLGPVEVRVGGQPLRFGAPRVQVVLAILLICHGQLVSVDQLVDELWAGEPPRHARTIVHGYVSRLRRALRASSGSQAAADRLVTRKPGYLLAVQDDELDLRRFERLVADGRAARQAGELDRCRRLFRQARAQWQGAPLAGAPASPTIDAERARLADLRLTVLEEQFDAELAAELDAGAIDQLVAELGKLVSEYPLRERLAGQLMGALYRSGRATDALAVYRQVRQRLVDELGLDPGAELVRLERAILRNEPVPGWSPATRTRPAQLPADLPVFAGRDAELAELLGPAGRAGAAVVISAIDGMAGVGKTALAVHAAHRQADSYPDGQLFIDLHGFTRGIEPVAAADALDRLLRSLGVPGEQIPHGLDDRSALFRSQLADRRMVVVLDNAATEAQVEPLLPGAPGCLVLVTSRRRLTGLDSALPVGLDVLPPTDAAELFAGIAGPRRCADQAVLEQVVELCGRLPLAVQIAAARLRARPAWTLPYLLERLRDERGRLAELTAGHRSVAAAFQVSYEHLGADQQRMFRLLGLHPGPDVDRTAAAALAGVDDVAAGRLLEDLVDGHLLIEYAPGRYRFHDLIRRYAAELAGTAGAAAGPALTRLFDHYLGTASRMAPRLKAVAEDCTALVWLDAERANLVAVAVHAAGHGWPAYAWQLSAVLHWYFDRQAHYDQAMVLHTSGLQATRSAGDPGRAEEGLVLNRLGVISQRVARHAEAVEYFELAQRANRSAGDRAGQAQSLVGLGVVHYVVGRFDEAISTPRRAADMFGQLGDVAGEVRAVGNLGLVYPRLGRYAEALRSHRHCLRLCRESGDRVGEGQTLYSMGAVHRLTGEPAKAVELLEQAVQLFRQLGYRPGESYALADLGGVYGQLGRSAEALDCHQVALAISRETGERNAEVEALLQFGETLRKLGRPEQALVHHQAALALAVEVDQLHDQARAHEAIGHIQHSLGNPDLARDYWVRAMESYGEMGAPEAEQLRVTLDAAPAGG